MEFPSSQAESPSSLRGISGPSRTRLQARQHRNSNLKPYDRRSLIANNSRNRTDSLLSSSAISAKSEKSKADGESIKNGSVGLLSGLRQALFSKPLSWLSGAGTKVANTSLPSHATLSAAQRLAASVQGSRGSNDLESHVNGIAGKQRTIAPPESAPRNTLSTFSTTDLHHARSPSPARSSASAVIQSHGRQRLSAGPVPPSPKFGGSTLGTPGYKRNGSLRPESGSIAGGISASQSSPSYAFGYGSERRMAGINSTISAHNLHPPSPLASSSRNPLPSRSPFAMSRQSYAESSMGGSNMGGIHTLGTPSRSRPTSMFGGEMNRSRAGSIADSRMSISSQTPKRREWSSLKLAPPKAEISAGEELMQAYLAMRNGATDSSHSPAYPALQDEPNTDTLMMEFGAGPSLHSPMFDKEGSLKRGVDMSVDGDEIYSEATPRKKQKQMVWDTEMGFVSTEELRAKRPPKPIAQNEAERLLNALEGMKSSPVVGGSKYHGATPSRQMMSVPVPLPVPDRNEMNGSLRRKKVEDLSKTVSPYSRAMRSKLSQSVEPEEGRGLKGRLRKSVRASSRASSPEADKQRGEAKEVFLDAGMDHEDVGEDRQSSTKSEGMEEGEDEEDIVEPPRRKLGSTISNVKKDETKTLRSGKILPPSPLKNSAAAGTVATHLSPSKLSSSLAQSSKPMSKARLEISASGTSAANKQRATQSGPPLVLESRATPASKESVSHFQVLSDPPLERTRSNLRQGAEKTHRTHVKSGRVGLDDDDEEDEVDDLPSADELNKIKLPTNLFPQGFSFSGSTSTSFASNGTTTSFKSPALPVVEQEDKAQEYDKTRVSQATSSSKSLFDRLGDFAPPSQTSTEAATSSMPSFSFPSPAKTNDTPTLKPSHGFEMGSSSDKSKAAVPAFSFEAPVKTSEPAAEPASKPLFSFQPSPSAEAKKTDVPNFSFSAPPKAANIDMSASKPSLKFPSSTSTEESKNASIPFSFGAPASKESETVASPAAAANTPFFSSAAPSTDGGKPSTPSFSFGGPAKISESTLSTAEPSISFASTRPADTNKDTSSGFSFAAPTKTSESSMPASKPLFSFGSTTESSKVETPSFSFHSPSSKAPEPSKSPFGFSSPAKASAAAASSDFFSIPNASTKEASAAPSIASTPKSDGAIPNFFASSLAKTNQPGFSFSSSSPTKAESTPTAAVPSVPFGSNGGGGNPFGQSTTNTTSFGSASTTTSTAPSSTPFGSSSSTPITNTQSSNPFGNAAPTSNAPSIGGFGSNGFNTSAGDGSRQGSPAPFGFGSTNNVSTQPISGGFGSGGGFGQNQGTTSTPSTPAFTFGAPSKSSAPASPAAATGSGFNFTMPSVGNNGTNNNSFISANATNSGQATPFVFGSAGANTPPVTQTGASGFDFNMGSTLAAAAPQSPSSGNGGANLFNMGAAPPPGSGGNRPVRGMPSRRKR